jgi:hypothetical protein
VDLPETTGPAHGGVGHVVLQRCPDAFDGVAVRAVAGACSSSQAGMLLQVGSDRPGVMDAVVVADHHDHRSAGNASASMRSKAMKSAAQRRPSRYTQAPVLTSIAPNTVTCRFLPGVATWPFHRGQLHRESEWRICREMFSAHKPWTSAHGSDLRRRFTVVIHVSAYTGAP